MKDNLLENLNNASRDYPFLEFNSRNLNYYPHIHDEIEIIFVASGYFNYTADGIEKTANEGDICIFMPQQIHSFSSPESNLVYILKLHSRNSKEKINFNLIRFENCLLKKDDPLNHVIKECIYQLQKEDKDRHFGYGFIANSLSNKIISLILRSNYITILDDNYEKQIYSSAKLLSDVNEYIADHYNETIYLEDLANYCHMSKYYFAHQLKKITNVSFYDYLVAYRLDNAVSLLTTSTLSISDIAQQSGFSNTRSFNRVFKEHFDCTPSEYRRK